MSSTRVALLMLLGTTALAACATPQSAVPENALEGTSWRFVELYGSPVQQPQVPDAREASLAFGTRGRLFGSDGCNRLLGSYTVERDHINVRDMAGTQMACLSAQESTRRLPEALKDAQRGDFDGPILTLYSAAGLPLAILERLPPREL